MARPLDDAISAAFGTRHDALQRTTLVDEDDGDFEIIHIRASKVGDNGIKAGVWYSLDKQGNFVEVN